MTQEELNEALKKHKLWLRGNDDGERFLAGYGEDFSGLDFSLADLRCANLPGADLTGTNLICANLADACLRNANLIGADLTEADMTNVDLHGARLERARFTVHKKSEDLILNLAKNIEESRKKKSSSDMKQLQ